MTKLIAYPGGEEQKAAIIAELQAHADADELVKGQYWQGGKGCAVGCTIKSSDHAEYETRFGIPQSLARLEDAIFEALPNDAAQKWPMRFMGAIRPGADLSLVVWQFLAFVVRDALAHPDAESVRAACQPTLHVLDKAAIGEPIDRAEAEAAALAAARADAAAWAAEEAAWAAWAAEAAAEAAEAEAAARAARAARAAALAAAAAEAEAAAEAWLRFADALIKLIEEAPILEKTR